MLSSRNSGIMQLCACINLCIIGSLLYNCECVQSSDLRIPHLCVINGLLLYNVTNYNQLKPVMWNAHFLSIFS